MASKTGERRWGMVFLSLLVVLLLGVLGRCWQLQYCQVEEHRDRVYRQQLKIVPQTARRGAILDRKGRILAASIKTLSVRADPSWVDDVDQAAKLLAAALDLDAQALRDGLLARRHLRHLWVKRFVSEEEAQRVRSLNLRGVVLESDYERRYPMGTLASHVIGFCDIDGGGLEGIERQYDASLKPTSGKWLLVSDALRRPVAPQGQAQKPQDGSSVVLTLDAMIQSVVEEQIKEVAVKFRAQGALGIVMDPLTGEILAMANWPTFDPKFARQSPVDLRRNRILTDPFEPGSTFKPFTVAAAMEGGFVRIDQPIFCHNGYYTGKGIGVIREYEGHGYGELTVAEVIVRSSNIGAAKIAQEMGKEYFYQQIERFGFGRKTGIDLPGEGPGILTPLAEWKWGQYALTRAAYGQGPVVVTALQLTGGFACLCNGGVLIQPRVTRGILTSDGDVLSDFAFAGGQVGQNKPEQVISPEVSRLLVQQALRPVVERQGGTARRADVEGYQVFGKTGTAQIPREDGRGYSTNKYIASFIAGAPAANPRICVLVSVREPDRSLGLGYTGGMVAAPVVREIVNQTLIYLGVPKIETVGEENSNA